MPLRQRLGEKPGGGAARARNVASRRRHRPRRSAALRSQLSSVPPVAAMHPPTPIGAREDADLGLLADRADPERGNRLATNGAALCARHVQAHSRRLVRTAPGDVQRIPGSSASTSRHVSSSAASRSSSTVTGPTVTRKPRADAPTSSRLLTFRNLYFFSVSSDCHPGLCICLLHLRIVIESVPESRLARTTLTTSCAETTLSRFSDKAGQIATNVRWAIVTHLAPRLPSSSPDLARRCLPRRLPAGARLHLSFVPATRYPSLRGGGPDAGSVRGSPASLEQVRSQPSAAALPVWVRFPDRGCA